jgi:6-methylsalicylate decarboxylase
MKHIATQNNAETKAAGDGQTALSGFRCLSRRKFLAGIAVLSANALTAGKATVAQPQILATAKPHRIDIHHHLTPPGWLAEVAAPVNPLIRQWTPSKSIEAMDKTGVGIAIVSITSPGLWFGEKDTTRHLARECNDYAAKLVQDRPDRFGMFAAMPMPDVHATLREIEYAFDTLKADGVGLFTSYGDKWLGNALFAPIYEELNRRKAVVFTHPIAANCCRQLIAEVPPPTIEFPVDTTRAIASLLFTGTAGRYPDIRFIFSHAGGTMPFLIERFMRLEQITKDRARKLPKGIQYELKKFYYDVAQTTASAPLAALMKVVPTSQILFGTDFPAVQILDNVKGLLEYGLSPSDLAAIERENALKLLPRLKS